MNADRDFHITEVERREPSDPLMVKFLYPNWAFSRRRLLMVLGTFAVAAWVVGWNLIDLSDKEEQLMSQPIWLLSKEQFYKILKSRGLIGDDMKQLFPTRIYVNGNWGEDIYARMQGRGYKTLKDFFQSNLLKAYLKFPVYQIRENWNVHDVHRYIDKDNKPCYKHVITDRIFYDAAPVAKKVSN